jgi:copper chaperone CopZ
MDQALKAHTPAFGGRGLPAVPSAARNASDVTLIVANMRCGGCMAAVEKALLASPGVVTARANLAAKRVAVRFDPGRTDSEALASVLERAGFHAAEATHLGGEEGRAHSADLLRRLAVAGFAAANIMLLSVSVWAGLALAGEIGRPATDRFDRKLDFAAVRPGVYEADAAGLEPGWWTVGIEGRGGAGGEVLYEARERLWIKP